MVAGKAAVRGLCIATSGLNQARRLQLAWAGAVSEGMLLNFFTEGGQAAGYNSADASLWPVVAVHDQPRAARTQRSGALATRERDRLLHAKKNALQFAASPHILISSAAWSPWSVRSGRLSLHGKEL